MTFRPYPGFTIACVLLFAILCGLGFWQLERLQWKLALIAQVNGNMAAAPVSLGDILAMDQAAAQYRHVTLHGHFDHAKEAYVFTTDAGAAVYHVLTPFTADDGRVLMVDRGEVPKGKLNPASRTEGNITGDTQVTGIWRTPDAPGSFTPQPDAAQRIWYARDLTGIAAAYDLKLAAPVVIEADATPNPGGWPKGGKTVVTFRNQHLGYAITWFGVAIVLLGVWLAYHISRGRIAFK
jgi:surfeit locus 1 family protein